MENFAVITVLMDAFIGILEIRTTMEDSIVVTMVVIIIPGKGKVAFRMRIDNDEKL